MSYAAPVVARAKARAPFFSGRTAVVLGVSVFALASLAPLIYVLVQSIRAEGGGGWTLDNWSSIYRDLPILTGFKNSLILAGSSALLSVVVASSAGFAFAKLPFRGSKFILTLVILTLMLPVISAIVPEYLNLVRFSLIGSYPPTILVYTSFNTAFAVIFFTNYFNSVPTTFIDAAVSDGAGYISVFLRVMLPMAVPALVTIFVFDFLIAWNDLLVALLFMPQADHQTLSVILGTINGAHEYHPGIILAGVFVSTIPNAVLFLCFQRYLVLGFSVGVEK
jgi:multiple sugar transport system permease protein